MKLNTRNLGNLRNGNQWSFKIAHHSHGTFETFVQSSGIPRK